MFTLAKLVHVLSLGLWFGTGICFTAVGLSLFDNPRVIVRGSAGTGKTLLAVEEAKRAAAQGSRVLYCCFNKGLAEYVRRVLAGSAVALCLDTGHLLVGGTDPADLTRQITAIQMQLLDLAKAKTEALAAARHLDLQALQPSINRLAKTK